MYFKILREDLTHYGYTYHKGLNVDSNPFEPVPNRRNGLCFADEKTILGFCNYGTKIAKVTIPEGEAIVLVGEEYKAHRIILGSFRELWTKETFKWLISCGADIHADDDYALICASESGHGEVVRLLLESGANVHARNDHALCQATANGHEEVVRLLLESGANVHACDDLALHWATLYKNLNVVKLLIEYGTDIHAGDDWALRCASENGYVEVVEYLKSLY